MAVQNVLTPQDAFFHGKPFVWDGRLFTTVQDFENYLAAPGVSTMVRRWAKRVTAHHTYIPTVEQWIQAGRLASCKGVVRTWRDTNGWPTGPNMIIAPEGIYLASGLAAPGIHATVCNSDGIGIEIVGNYDNAYWKEPILSFVFGAFVALSRILGHSPDDVVNKKRVNGHNECNSLKSCPGNAIDLDKFRKDVAARMAITQFADAHVIGVAPSVTQGQFKEYLRKYHAPVPPLELDRVYMLAAWLQVDPAFLAALWKQEAFVDIPNDGLPATAVIGGSPLQQQSRNPLNIVESSQPVRDVVTYNGRNYREWSTWQLGLMDAILHLKEEHGDKGRLTVRQIIPVHSPANGGVSPDTIVANVLTRMAEMKTL